MMKKTEAKPVDDRPAAAFDSFSISQGQVVEVPASQGPPHGAKTVAAIGASVHWAPTPDVLADPHEIPAGTSLTINSTIYLMSSSGTARVVVTQQERPAADHPARA
jgi:hypothetical protein